MRSTLAALASATPSETTVILNPSPLLSREEAKVFPWAKVDWLIVNRNEAAELCDAVGVSTGTDTAEKEDDLDPRELLERMGTAATFRKTNIVCTLGADGVLARLAQEYWESPGAEQEKSEKAVHVPAAALRGDVRDTTGAGDCFAGYFVKVLMDLSRERKVGAGAGARGTVSVKELENILRVCVVVGDHFFSYLGVGAYGQSSPGSGHVCREERHN